MIDTQNIFGTTTTKYRFKHIIFGRPALFLSGRQMVGRDMGHGKSGTRGWKGAPHFFFGAIVNQKLASLVIANTPMTAAWSVERLSRYRL